MPLTFDDSIIRFCNELKREEDTFRAINSRYTTNIISISGGLRDKIITPRLCSANGMDHGGDDVGIALSILASDVMQPKASGKNRAPMYGMDHMAIVWCHNIVSIVRDLIHGMKVSPHITTSGKTAWVQTYISEKLESNTGTCPKGFQIQVFVT